MSKVVRGAFGHHREENHGLGYGFGEEAGELKTAIVPVPLNPPMESRAIDLQSAEDIAVSVLEDQGVKAGNLLSKVSGNTSSIASREKLIWFGAGVLVGLWKSWRR